MAKKSKKIKEETTVVTPTSEYLGKPKMSNKEYAKELEKLQVQLCYLQDWVVENKKRIVIIFEGRDGAGKGGTIKALTERVSPRVFKVVALPAPSDREKTQVYFQRYFTHLPAGGEIVIFDRSWYNRLGVEKVMGYCTEKEHAQFLEICAPAEKVFIENGMILIKFWMEVSDAEQERRFKARIVDPLRQWKLSPVDLPSRERWYDYSLARDQMLEATDTEMSPWHIVYSDDKKRARLNTIAQLLDIIPYKRKPRKKVELPKRSMANAYDDQASIANRRWVRERY
jgi:polyphosphate kinase 2